MTELLAGRRGRDDEERRRAGITCAFRGRGLSQMREFSTTGEVQTDLVSRRVMKLGNAFQNYRRAVLDRLEKLQRQKMDAAEADPDTKWVDYVWTDYGMLEFLKNDASFEA